MKGTTITPYVPAQIGEGKYLPDITVGVAKFDDLRVIEAEPFDAFAVHPASVAIYHLGNDGTARKLLKDARSARAPSARVRSRRGRQPGSVRSAATWTPSGARAAHCPHTAT